MPTSCPSPLSAIRVPPTKRPALFEAFAQAHGVDLAAAYGVWPPPHLLVAPQQVWSFEYQGRTSVGWGALTAEPSEQAAWISVGIWPDWARCGVRHAIRNQLVAFAQRDGVSQVRIGVLLTNGPHLQRCLAESAAGGAWRHAGMVWWPTPGCVIFTQVLA